MSAYYSTFLLKIMSEKNKQQNTGAMQYDTVLAAGYSYKIGQFTVMLDEDTNELKVIVHQNRNRLTIKPNSDNSCTLVACR
jgi:hypothetical protein